MVRLKKNCRLFFNPQISPQRNRLRPDEIGFAFHWAGISQGRPQRNGLRISQGKQITQTPMNVRWRLRNLPGLIPRSLLR